jgi:hypothetical protein
MIAAIIDGMRLYPLLVIMYTKDVHGGLKEGNIKIGDVPNLEIVDTLIPVTK